MNKENPLDSTGTFSNQVCEKCLKSFDEGQLVPIYFGKVTSQELNSEWVRINYDDVSMKEYFICQACINKDTKILFWIGLGLLVSFLPPCCVIGGSTSGGGAFFFISLIATIIGFLLVLITVIQKLFFGSGEKKIINDHSIASNKAKALARKELKNSGYNSFWTKEEFESLVDRIKKGY